MLLLAACTNSARSTEPSSGDGASSTAPPKASRSSSLSTRTSSPTKAELHVMGRQTFVVKAQVVGHVSLFGHWVAYTSSGTSYSSTNTVSVIDRRNGTVRTVATSAWAHGQTDWVEGTGDWVFWTDQSFAASDTTLPAWTIKGKNLLTGRVVELDHSDRWASPTPIPRAGNGYLTWFRGGNKAQTFETLWTYKPRTAVKRRLGTGHYSTVTPAKSFVAFDAWLPSSDQTKVMVTDLATGKTRAIGAATDAGNARAADGSNLLAWLEPATGDSTSVDWQNGVTGRPTSFSESGAYDAVPGDHFIAIFDNDGSLSVVNADNAEDKLTISRTLLYVPCRIAASGNAVAWCDQQSMGRVNIRIAEVE